VGQSFHNLKKNYYEMTPSKVCMTCCSIVDVFTYTANGS